MKGYLITSGTIFALMAVMHLFITIDHWGQGNPDLWFVLAPAMIFVAGTALAIWAFKLIRRATTAAGTTTR